MNPTDARHELTQIAGEINSLSQQIAHAHSVIRAANDKIRALRKREEEIARAMAPKAEILSPAPLPQKRHKITLGDIQNLLKDAETDDDTLISLAMALAKSKKKEKREEKKLAPIKAAKEAELAPLREAARKARIIREERERNAEIARREREREKALANRRNK